MELSKRKHHYLLPPSKFEIACCSCGNENTQWSEYEKHLWCDQCNIDFIPSHNGIFDGPIALQTAELFGIVFHRKNLISNKFEILNSAQTIEYIEVLNLNLKKDECNTFIKVNDNIYNGKIIYNDKEFYIKYENIPDGNYNIEIATYKNSFNLWKFSISVNNNIASIIPSKSSNLLSKIILNSQLEISLNNNNLIQKNKI